ncbi:MAG: spore coat associated protein CotJA [Lachnospiraceae bacterium]|nr:spore coat associated protein CotJA [Lachnospiraceae bacterium]
MADYRRNPYGRQSCCQQPEPSRPVAPPAPPAKPGFSEKFPLAMAYVPWQQWMQTYDLDRALAAGTIFPELDKPFMGVRKGGCAK